MGLVALALLHVSAAAHQFEHEAEHNQSVCEACGTYNQLEDAAIPTPPSDVVFVASDGIVAGSQVDSYQGPLTLTYRSRAPPRF